jgi:hypothetical protein
MDGASSKFKFLTMEEFSQLSRREKAAYLEVATAEIEKDKREVTLQTVFKDGPSMPAVEKDEGPRLKISGS